MIKPCMKVLIKGILNLYISCGMGCVSIVAVGQGCVANVLVGFVFCKHVCNYAVRASTMITRQRFICSLLFFFIFGPCCFNSDYRLMAVTERERQKEWWDQRQKSTNTHADINSSENGIVKGARRNCFRKFWIFSGQVPAYVPTVSSVCT